MLSNPNAMLFLKLNHIHNIRIRGIKANIVSMKPTVKKGKIEHRNSPNYLIIILENKGKNNCLLSCSLLCLSCSLIYKMKVRKCLTMEDREDIVLSLPIKIKFRS